MQDFGNGSISLGFLIIFLSPLHTYKSCYKLQTGYSVVLKYGIQKAGL